MKEKQRVASPTPGNVWTKAETYIGAMARARSFGRFRRERPRTEPEQPRLFLSTVPFLLLIGLLAILAVAIMVVAIPGGQPRPSAKQAAPHETGVAPRGWFQKAQKEFH